jgi:hypothetical protein
MSLEYRMQIIVDIFKLVELSVTGQHSSQCWDKNKHYVTSYVAVYKVISYATLPHMRNLLLLAFIDFGGGGYGILSVWINQQNYIVFLTYEHQQREKNLIIAILKLNVKQY